MYIKKKYIYIKYKQSNKYKKIRDLDQQPHNPKNNIQNEKQTGTEMFPIQNNVLEPTPLCFSFVVLLFLATVAFL